MIPVMQTSEDSRNAAIGRVREATDQLARVQELAQLSIKSAGMERARAFRDALSVMPAKDLATELGISVQRVYGLAREGND